MRDDVKFVEVCPICREPARYSSETEVLEMYDDGPGKPNDPRRFTTSPIRQMVPGVVTETWQPCGHQRRY